MCPPGPARAHYDRISTSQHTRVEVWLEVEVGIGLRVVLELSLDSWSRVGVVWGVVWGLRRG